MVVDGVLKKLVFPVLAVLLVSSVISLSRCDSTVELTISNDTHMEMTVTVVVNSGDGSSVDFGSLTPGDSAVRQLVEGWFGIQTISVQGTDSRGHEVYRRSYTLLEAKSRNGVFAITEQPSYFNFG